MTQYKNCSFSHEVSVRDGLKEEGIILRPNLKEFSKKKITNRIIQLLPTTNKIFPAPDEI